MSGVLFLWFWLLGIVICSTDGRMDCSEVRAEIRAHGRGGQVLADAPGCDNGNSAVGGRYTTDCLHIRVNTCTGDRVAGLLQNRKTFLMKRSKNLIISDLGQTEGNAFVVSCDEIVAIYWQRPEQPRESRQSCANAVASPISPYQMCDLLLGVSWRRTSSGHPIAVLLVVLASKTADTADTAATAAVCAYIMFLCSSITLDLWRI